MLEKFGKSFRDIAGLKTAFFEDNDRLLTRTLGYADLYNSQPRRTRCKICDAELPNSPSFNKHRIDYVICTRCTHLNGMREDTDEFCQAIYTAGGGQEYAENYSSADADAYVRRRASIYTPKAEFLIATLLHQGENPTQMRFADMGAGSGYFVSAMRELGHNIEGYEVGKAQVALGNWMMPSRPLHHIALSETADLCRMLPADVLTFIGVFEHVQSPREILRAIKANPATQYFYICVPMFGPCIYSEMVFPDVMPRQLAIGHTHLFTNDSIRHFEREFGVERCGAWWFGTDMMDYYRSVVVSLGKNPHQRSVAQLWRATFEPLIDDLQLAIDRQRACGQVHMVFKVAH